jgi:hypothetical protein
MDNVLLTAAQIVEHFKVSAGAVRTWVAAGKIAPIRREGRGRSGQMYFARGEVAALVYGLCPVCGNGFRRARLSQRFCGRACRQKSARMQANKQEKASHE